MSVRIVSHGGGVQTTALLVLAVTGELDYSTFVFANVGDDSEHPATLRYLREIAAPYAREHGISLVEIARKGSTLYQHVLSDVRAVAIPMRMPGGMPGNRTCTGRWKIDVIDRYCRQHGATVADPAIVAVGLSADEIGRVNSRRRLPTQRLHYPLIGMLDGEPTEPVTGRPLRRSDCIEIIRRAGLPVPGKSACWFCPFTRPEQWAQMSRQDPELFARAAEFERAVSAKRQQLPKPVPLYLTRFGRPLAEAVALSQDVLAGTDDDPHCDNGWCMT